MNKYAASSLRMRKQREAQNAEKMRIFKDQNARRLLSAIYTDPLLLLREGIVSELASYIGAVQAGEIARRLMAEYDSKIQATTIKWKDPGLGEGTYVNPFSKAWGGLVDTGMDLAKKFIDTKEAELNKKIVEATGIARNLDLILSRVTASRGAIHSKVLSLDSYLKQIRDSYATHPEYQTFVNEFTARANTLKGLGSGMYSRIATKEAALAKAIDEVKADVTKAASMASYLAKAAQDAAGFSAEYASFKIKFDQYTKDYVKALQSPGFAKLAQKEIEKIPENIRDTIIEAGQTIEKYRIPALIGGALLMGYMFLGRRR